MKLTTSANIPVYTIAGEGTSRPLPEWLARKRKRSLKKDAEYANRVELLQDFEFEEASQCVRVSEDGEWVVSTGTYKPQMHVHNLSQLALSYTRHTDALNQTFVLLSSDYSKSLHLQTDRSLEFHTPGGLHYSARIPRYGRDLKYNKRTAEALIPSVGVNEDGNGEVFRLNLEVGRFMKGFEVDVGGDDLTSLGGGALQGGIATGSVNCAAIAEESHGLMAFGTSTGIVEFWDARSRDRVSVLRPPSSISMLDTGQDEFRSAITALEFHPSGLNLATGSSNGLIHTYDLRSPIPLLRKDQGYDSPIQTLQYLNSTSISKTSSSSNVAPNKLLSSDRKSIKLFSTDAIGEDNNNLWTSIQPSVDLNHVAWVSDSGMLLTANEGRQQHAFFIPQLGPAPKWCSFLDNLVEEMDTDANSGNPNVWKPIGITNSNGVGDVYDNYKFVSNSELAALNLDHLVGDSKTNVLRPYMHGFFVPQRLYEQARLLANPDLALEQRQKSIQAKIEKERESRIRGNKKVAVKVNRKLAEKLAAREEANERRKAARMLRKQGGVGEDDEDVTNMPEAEVETKPLETASSTKAPKKARMDLMDDARFRGLFEDEDFEIDEESREYQLHNPSSATTGGATKDVLKKSGLTAVEEEDLEDARRASSDDDDDSDETEDNVESARQRQRSRGTQRDDEDNAAKGRIGSASYKKSGHQSKQQRSKDSQQKSGPRMRVSSSQQPSQKARLAKQGKSFGDLASGLSSRERSSGDVSGVKGRGVVGEKEVSFVPEKKKGGKKFADEREGGRDVRRATGGAGRGGMRNRNEGRRSASGNVFRRM